MTFAWPTALIGLALVPVLLGFYLWIQRQRRRYAVRFTNLALLREVVGRGPGMWRHIPPLLFLLGMAALLVSLARPSLVLAVPRDQASVMLVLDVSGSMDARDLQPTRLGAARQAAKKLVDGLPSGAQVGVVAFSDRATLAAPLRLLAQRHEVVAARLRDARESSLPDVGLVTFEDPETGEQLTVNTSNRRLRERFSLAAAAQTQRIETVLTTCGVDQVVLGTDEPMLPALANFLDARRRRRGARWAGRPGPEPSTA